MATSSGDHSASLAVSDETDHTLQPFFVLHKAQPPVNQEKSSRSGRGAGRRKTAAGSSPKSPQKLKQILSEIQDPHSDSFLEQLRLDAFDKTWSKIHSTIQGVLRDINLKLFDEVLQWIEESFESIKSKPNSNEIQKPYPLICDTLCKKIPTSFVLTKNAEYVDDIQTFKDLGSHLKENNCHVANISALDFSTKCGIGGCIKSLLRQLHSESIDVADMMVLAKWYCEENNFNKPIIIMIDDLERCNGSILGDFITMLSEGHDGTVTSFITALKLACCKHFLLEPLSFLSLSIVDKDKEFWHEKFDLLPESLKTRAFDLPSCKREMSVVSLSKILAKWDIHTKGMDEINEKVKELQSLLSSPNEGQIYTENLPNIRSRRGLSLGATKQNSLNDKVAMLLDTMLRKYMVPIESIPFHEIICFKNVNILQSALIGDPRRTIQLDLFKSSNGNSNSLSSSMHDTSIMYNLAQEYGDVINLHDWFQSFKTIITNNSSQNNSKKKKTNIASPSKRQKSNISPPETEALMQARFCRAVMELQITGLLRMPSKRRPDFVQRIAFGF
ncbi:hypothetical protein LUZ60_014164 [Juncus effusus]|nr:hypothetical protein LUZ60_014164 [Juncus effusus]